MSLASRYIVRELASVAKGEKESAALQPFIPSGARLGMLERVVAGAADQLEGMLAVGEGGPEVCDGALFAEAVAHMAVSRWLAAAPGLDNAAATHAAGAAAAVASIQQFVNRRDAPRRPDAYRGWRGWMRQ